MTMFAVKYTPRNRTLFSEPSSLSRENEPFDEGRRIKKELKWHQLLILMNRMDVLGSQPYVCLYLCYR